MATYKEAFEKSLEYFKGDQLAPSVFLGKYALTDSNGDIKELTPDDMHRRLAKEFARIEKKYPNPMSEEEIYNLLKNFEFIVPQGSPMAAIGNEYQIQSASNCFVIDSCKDSYGGILKTDQEQVQLSKRRAGVGHDISNIRPKGMTTNNAAKTTDGIGIFMERFSNSCREVAQGGRRGALMLSISVHHPEIETFINIKRDKTKVTGANISVRLSDEFMLAVRENKEYELRWPVDSKNPKVKKNVNAKYIWDQIIAAAWESAEPGLLFWDTALKYTPSDIYSEFGFRSVSTNPCFSGDTLIAVADGRNYITIKQLAEEGMDVPVYSINQKTGKVSVKMGRHPRITGYNQKLIRIHLDNGGYVDVTPNHTFILRDGTEILAKDLKNGDSLPSFKKITKKIKHDSKFYYNVKTNINISGNKAYELEHRLISKFYYPETWEKIYNKEKSSGWVKGGLVVHHIDYNSLNNSPTNLQIMTFKDHVALHASMDCQGEKNGKYSGYTKDQLIEFGKELCVKLSRKFSKKEWIEFAKERNIPQSFSKFRKDQFGDYDFSEICANELGLKYINEDPRLVRTYLNMIEMGYESKIVDNSVVVKKTCEECRNGFYINHLRREIAYCSHKCAMTYTYRNYGNGVRENQVKIYSNLKFSLGRIPAKKEWELECSKNNVTHRIGRVLKNGFQTYKELKEAGNDYNHKVVSIEELSGEHTVYNITVDDNHTLAVVNSIDDKNLDGIFVKNCGEIILSREDSCRLLTCNLMGFVKNQFKENSKFDFELFSEKVIKAQRLMDDLVDIELEQIDKILNKIESDPESMEIKKIELDLWKNIRKYCEMGRRTGLGPTAVGDALAALGIRYGSDESIEMVEEIYKAMEVNSYISSIILAKERGHFPIWNYELEKDHSFLNRVINELPKEYQEMYKVYGRRNIANTTTAPTGSVSVMTQTTSGIEPAYRLWYVRRKKINPNDVDARVDFVDELGDKWQEFKVYHHNYKKWMEISGKDNVEESPYYKATADDVDWVASVKMQAAAQKWICHAISKTCNLPNSATKELVSEVYMKAWETGCKGFTVYRDGCRSGVLVSEETKEKDKQKSEIQDDPNRSAPKRPKKLECDIHQVTIKGDSWTIFVGKYEDRPYEIFGGLSTFVHIPKKIKRGTIVKIGKQPNGAGVYDLLYGEEGDETRIHDIVNVFENPTEGAFTRTLSLSLRHGVPIQYITEQLQKDDKCSDMYSFSKVISRVLKHYIKEGTKASDKNCEQCGAENSIVYKEGCKICLHCSYSKCG